MGGDGVTVATHTQLSRCLDASLHPAVRMRLETEEALMGAKHMPIRDKQILDVMRPEL